MHRAALWRRIQEPAVASSSDMIGSGYRLDTQGTSGARTLDRWTGRYSLTLEIITLADRTVYVRSGTVSKGPQRGNDVSVRSLID